MTSPTNTAGLEVVAFRVHDWADGWIYFEDKYWAGRECKDDDREPEPLVTAASAQARIAALEARVAELEATKWEAQHADTMNDLVAMGLARDAAEARADRLAGAARNACDLLAERTCGHAARSPGHNARLVLEYALQDQPK